MPLYTDTCPRCFRSRVFGGVCPRCGFVPEMEEQRPLALPYMSILKKQYVTGQILGVGGFGITYTAFDAGSGRLCCIKEYCPTEYVGGRNPSGNLLCKSREAVKEFKEAKEHFLDEAEILETLKSNIAVVDAWESFEENDTAYYVMELLKGENLRQYRKDHSLESTKAVALQMLFTIGNALGEIHRYGLLHGDISPENIIVTENRTIKLIDFGTARAITQPAEDKDGKVYLKPSYAPPELYDMQAKQGAWSDVYSLAATYYTVVSGTKMISAGRRKAGEAYPALCEMPEVGISPELSGVIDRALALDYHDRYQSMMEFMGAVSRVTRESDLVDAGQEEISGTQLLSRDVLNEVKNMTAAFDDALQSINRSGWFRKKKRSFQYLELLEEGRVIRRWSLEANREMSVGRHPQSDIMTPSHGMISRNHCRITYMANRGDFILEDVSTYGTYLRSGERLIKGAKYRLRDGDQFYLYSPRFMFRVVTEN